MLHAAARRLLGGRGIPLLAAGLVALAGASLWAATRPRPALPAAPPAVADEGEPPASPSVLVFVSGAVAHPGLYHLTASARIADALAAAGGLAPGADPGRLPNEAGPVHDGRQINVPFLHAGSSRAAVSRLDLNEATADELRSVPGMPAGLPEAIVEHRRQWGPFASVSELGPDLGVDRATVAALGRELRVVRPP